jgi:hypothetical protein
MELLQGRDRCHSGQQQRQQHSRVRLHCSSRALTIAWPAMQAQDEIFVYSVLPLPLQIRSFGVPSS